MPSRVNSRQAFKHLKSLKLGGRPNAPLVTISDHLRWDV